MLMQKESAKTQEEQMFQQPKSVRLSHVRASVKMVPELACHICWKSSDMLFPKQVQESSEEKELYRLESTAR